ncbi:MAG: hypothetical protein LBL94_00800 [Prevotellaceae bacterium]|jgi:hypothetical protein|nr:hypothetical protein [Prevotellaceae bacterium]
MKYHKYGIFWMASYCKCKVCQRRFSETRHAIFFRSRYSDSAIQSILRSVVENPDKTLTPRTPALCAGITDKVWDIKYAFAIPYIDDN